MSATKITKCPTCGSKRIRRVRSDVSIDIGKLHYVTPNVEFEKCPNCGEEIFDLTAMEKIQAYRPSLGRPKVRRRKTA
ncbi:MAG: YgiT-type zinc finger protein [Tepidisphaeraceae bacterium]|jgi:YgiT-type zinc finger domain-containing protein